MLSLCVFVTAGQFSLSVLRHSATFPPALSISSGLRLVENARVGILDCHYCLSRIMCLNFVLKDLRCPAPSVLHLMPFAIRHWEFSLSLSVGVWEEHFPHFLSFSFVTLFVSLMLARLSKQPIINAVSHCHFGSCLPSVANKLDSSPLSFCLSCTVRKIKYKIWNLLNFIL